MFDSTSRYGKLPIAEISITGGDGVRRRTKYVRRRFVPPPANGGQLDHIITDGDRLDNLADQYLGDPTLFWQLCDANRAMNPFDLLNRPGDTLTVILPGFGEEL